MTYMFPHITAVYAAVLGLLGVVLTVNVIVNRAKSGVTQGDGSVPALAKAIRAHCNFAEQTPLAIILVGLVEAVGYGAITVHSLGVVLLAGRLLSAWGLTRTPALSFARNSGISLTILVVVMAPVLIIITGAATFLR